MIDLRWSEPDGAKCHAGSDPSRIHGRPAGVSGQKKDRYCWTHVEVAAAVAVVDNGGAVPLGAAGPVWHSAGARNSIWTRGPTPTCSAAAGHQNPSGRLPASTIKI